MNKSNEIKAAPNGRSRQVAVDAADTGLIVADIGGTNARFARVTATGQVADVRTLSVGDHAGVVQATRAYLDALAPGEGLGARATKLHRAAFAVASPIEGDEVRLTNGPWTFSRQRVAQELGLSSLVVLNDFEALALSLPGLGAHQIRAWGAAPVARGMLAVIGPGTGLGVAGVLETPHGWHAVSGEGGHATLASTDDFERQVLGHAQQSFLHVSAERLLSGTGLPLLHRAVAAVLGLASEPWSPETIIDQGLMRRDVACDRTIDTFCALLGSFSGNVALTLGARGGVYIGGGIVPRLGERFFQSSFRQRFEAKGRCSRYLQGVPTALITDTLAALSGAAFALMQIDHEGARR